MIRNQVTLVGLVPNEIALTTFENGSIVARFKVETTQDDLRNFHSVFAWGNVARFIQNNCKKGSRVVVTGRVVNRTYVSPEGKPIKLVEVEARDMIKLTN